MTLYVNGIGTLGPGLADWAGSRAVLAGKNPSYDAVPTEPSASLLPPNERRRSSESVRWALHVAQEAMQQAEADAREVATEFSPGPRGRARAARPPARPRPPRPPPPR